PGFVPPAFTLPVFAPPAPAGALHPMGMYHHQRHASPGGDGRRPPHGHLALIGCVEPDDDLSCCIDHGLSPSVLDGCRRGGITAHPIRPSRVSARVSGPPSPATAQ